jgi:hypothetical protein
MNRSICGQPVELVLVDPYQWTQAFLYFRAKVAYHVLDRTLYVTKQDLGAIRGACGHRLPTEFGFEMMDPRDS